MNTQTADEDSRSAPDVNEDLKRKLTLIYSSLPDSAPDNSRKLLAVILAQAWARQSIIFFHSYFYLSRETGIAKPHIGQYLKQMELMGLFTIHRGELASGHKMVTLFELLEPEPEAPFWTPEKRSQVLMEVWNKDLETTEKSHANMVKGALRKQRMATVVT